jgi:hypothetical protein
MKLKIIPDIYYIRTRRGNVVMYKYFNKYDDLFNQITRKININLIKNDLNKLHIFNRNLLF